jgi:hypothetical protein
MAHTPQFDEQWRLIRADEVAWAYEKASVIGRLDENCFTNADKESMVWKFMEVADIHRIGEWEDGAKLFSATEEPTDANAYIAQLKMKSQKAFALARSREINLAQKSLS